MKTTIKLQGKDYTLNKAPDGWYEISGPDSFKFKRDENFCWQFTKVIDPDLRLALLVNVVTMASWGFTG